MSADGVFVAFSCQRATTGVWLAVVAQIVCDGQSPPVVQDWWVFEHGSDADIWDINHDLAGTVRAYGYAGSESYLWVKIASDDTFGAIQIPRHEGQRILPRSGNAKGELAGNVTLSQWAEAVHFDADLHLQFMGRLGSGTRSIAESINDDSLAAG